MYHNLCHPLERGLLENFIRVVLEDGHDTGINDEADMVNVWVGEMAAYLDVDNDAADDCLNDAVKQCLSELMAESTKLCSVRWIDTSGIWERDALRREAPSYCLTVLEICSVCPRNTRRGGSRSSVRLELLAILSRVYQELQKWGSVL